MQEIDPTSDAYTFLHSIFLRLTYRASAARGPLSIRKACCVTNSGTREAHSLKSGPHPPAHLPTVDAGLLGWAHGWAHGNKQHVEHVVQPPSHAIRTIKGRWGKPQATSMGVSQVTARLNCLFSLARLGQQVNSPSQNQHQSSTPTARKVHPSAKLSLGGMECWTLFWGSVHPTWVGTHVL